MIKCFGARFALACALALSLFSPGRLRGGGVELAWNASASPSAIGYNVYYGLNSGDYDGFVEVGDGLNVTLSDLTPGLVYYFAATSYDVNGLESSLSDEIAYRVPIPASITLQPLPQTANLGGAATLTAGGGGDPPLGFQWWKGGAPIAGATAALLNWPRIVDANAGSYSVIVSNPWGSATSSVVALTVIDPPVITTQPQSQTAGTGATASFSFVATSAAPLSVQWYFGAPAVGGIGWIPIAGATNTVLTLAKVAASNAGSYRCTVSNSAGAVTSSAATLTVITPPAIITQPLSLTVGLGLPASFLVVATGTAPLSVQWYFGATPIAGANNALLAFLSVAAANAGSYHCTVSNAAGVVTSSVATLSLLSAPIIITQPQSQTVAASATVTFSSVVVGTAPLSVQWYFGTTPIVGATNTVLTLPSVTAANAGSYHFTVSNSAGAVTSSVVTLTVITPPSILTQPQSQTVGLAASATFSPVVSGTAPLSLQWYFGLTPIVGATNTVLALPSVTAANAGSYHFTVSNAAGAVTSSVVTLTVITPPSILTQPVSQTVGLAASATFSSVVTGTAPLSLQWYFGATALVGATNTTLTLPSVAAANAGSYYFTVSNAAGAVTSSVVTLTVITPPSILTQPVSQTVGLAASATFSSVVTGTAPLSLQWYFGATALVGATNAVLTLPSVTAANAGSYHFTVSNSAGAVTSSVVTLTVITPPSVLTQPVSQTVGLAASATFSSVVSGTAPLSLQWYFGLTPIVGATNNALTLPSVTAANAGSYYFTVSNAAGAVTSSVVTLTVITPPAIITQPVSQTVALAASATFSSVVGGTAPLSLQWYFGATALVGATNTVLTLPSVAAANAGSYYFTVSNSAGAVTSSVVTLTVITPPSILTQPQSQTVGLAASASFSPVVGGTAPLSLQWYFGATALVGATNAVLTLPSVAAANAGSYYFTVSNAVGAVTSSVVTLTVITAPSILTQPQSQTVALAASATFSSVVSGTAPLSLQWYFGATALVGANNTALTLPSVTAANAGSYYFTVSNAAGAVTSSVVTLTVITPPSILTQPVSQTVGLAASATFSSVVSGTAPLSLQWYFGATALVGATNTALTLPSVTAANAGSYYFTVSNAAGAVTSSVVTLTVITPPSILTQPVSQTVGLAASATFSSVVSGTAPLSLQWYFGATALVGATNAALTLPSVAAANAGSYYFTVSNAAGAVTSSVVTLTVITPPSILTQPVSQTVGLAASATFSSVVTGTAPLSLQWYFGATALVGATNTALTLPSVTAANAGSYYFTVSNAAGAVTSSVVTLTLLSTGSIGAAAGAYNGLFFQINADGTTNITEATAGLLGNCIVASNGVFSGKVFLGGLSFSLAGVVDSNGNTSVTIPRPSTGLSNLTVVLHLDLVNGTRQMTGTISSIISNIVWTAPLLADEATNASPNLTAVALLLYPGSAANAPATLGLLEGSAVNSMLSLSGQLGDTVAMSQTVPISKDGNVPVYASLYNNSGLIEGWVNVGVSGVSGNLTWIRPAGVLQPNGFPLGFSTILPVKGQTSGH